MLIFGAALTAYLDMSGIGVVRAVPVSVFDNTMTVH